MGKNILKECVYVYVYIYTYIYIIESLCCIAETNITLWINYTSTKILIKKKNKDRTTVWSSNPSSEYTAQGNEITILYRLLHSHVHCSVIDNSQDTETI